LLHYFKSIIITLDKNYLYYIHNYFLIEHNYPQFVIYNFKSYLIFLKIYNVIEKIIVMIVILGIII